MYRWAGALEGENSAETTKKAGISCQGLGVASPRATPHPKELYGQCARQHTVVINIGPFEINFIKKPLTESPPKINSNRVAG